MSDYYGNILIQQESFCFPRTPFGANILTRTFLLASGLGCDTRRGLVAGSVAVVSQLNQHLNHCRDAATVKNHVPRVRARACAHARAHVAICLSRRRGVAAHILFSLITLKRKNKRGVKTAIYPRHYPRRFFNNRSACRSELCKLLIINKKGGF